MTLITDDDLKALLTDCKREQRVAEDAAIVARGTPASGPLQKKADAAEREATEAGKIFAKRKFEAAQQRGIPHGWIRLG